MRDGLAFVGRSASAFGLLALLEQLHHGFSQAQADVHVSLGIVAVVGVGAAPHTQRVGVDGGHPP